MKLAIPKDGDGPEFAGVARRLRDKDGLSIGTANDSPMLDTRMYVVEFPDGHNASLVANAEDRGLPNRRIGSEATRMFHYDSHKAHSMSEELEVSVADEARRSTRRRRRALEEEDEAEKTSIKQLKNDTHQWLDIW
jgi:hypothetical protein